jgi:hypothetical protein
MPTTGIQRVYNETSDHYMLVKLEDTKNNRYVEGAQTELGDCWVPWCGNTGDLLKKSIVLVNRTKGTLAGFIWQDKDSAGDDRVRFQAKGWQAPTTANRISGFSEVGTKINLKIDKDGNISAEKSSPN